MQQQLPRDLEYEANNPAYCTENEIWGFKCKNFEVCGEVLPSWWYDCKEMYLCGNCHQEFGTWSNPEQNVYYTGKGYLDFADNVECPVCLETKRGVSQFNCDHFVCVDCFKRCYYGDKSGRPKFPYQIEVMDEWENDRDNPKWDIEYPLIRQWDEEDEEWLHNSQIKFDNESHLRKCPICQK
jgi:hypothetical protein